MVTELCVMIIELWRFYSMSGSKVAVICVLTMAFFGARLIIKAHNYANELREQNVNKYELIEQNYR